MGTSEELRARIERMLAAKAAERSAWPDIGMIAEPLLQQQEAERQRVEDERFASLGGGLPVLSKLEGRLSEWRDVRPQDTRQAMHDIEADGAATHRHDVRGACDLALRYLRGEIRDGGGMPGPCIAWCAQHGVDRLVPLPMCEEFRQQAEADLGPVAGRLQAELDSWEGIVRGSIDAKLPTLESHGTARVRNRATTTG